MKLVKEPVLERIKGAFNYALPDIPGWRDRKLRVTITRKYDDSGHPNIVLSIAGPDDPEKEFLVSEDALWHPIGRSMILAKLEHDIITTFSLKPK